MKRTGIYDSGPHGPWPARENPGVDPGDHEFVTRLSRSLTRRVEDAEDLEQELWLAILRSPPAAGDSKKPWFSVVAKRIRAGMIKKAVLRDEREQRYLVDRSQEHAGGTSHTPSIASAIALGKAIHRLSPVKQDVLRLRYDEGMSFQEIAGELHIEEPTARSHHHRALESLRGALNPQPSTEPRESSLRAFGLWIGSFITAPVRKRQSLTWGNGLLLAAGIATALVAVGKLPLLRGDGVAPLAGAPNGQPQLERLGLDSPAEGATRRPSVTGQNPNMVAETSPGPDARSAVPNEAQWPGSLAAPANLKVVDPTGLPVEGAVVRLFQSEPGSAIPARLPERLSTDVHGEAVIPAQRRGTWAIAEDHLGRQSEGVLLDFLGLARGEILLRLSEPPEPWPTTVVDSEGNPVEGARVTPGHASLLGIARSNTLAPLTWITNASATTDARGFASVPTTHRQRKTQVHLVTADGFAPLQFVGRVERVQLVPTRHLHGRVESDEPIATEGITVTMRLLETSASWETQALRDGSFVFEDAPVGPVEIRALADGMAAGVHQSLGKDVPGDVILMLDDHSMVQGRAVDRSGTAVAGARTQLLIDWHAETSLLAQSSHRTMRSASASTATDGSFSVECVDARMNRLLLLDHESERVIASTHLDVGGRSSARLVSNHEPGRTLKGQAAIDPTSGRFPRFLVAASDWEVESFLVAVDPVTGRFELNDVRPGALWLQPMDAVPVDPSLARRSPLNVQRIEIDQSTSVLNLRQRPASSTLRAFGEDGEAVEKLHVVVVEGHSAHHCHSGPEAPSTGSVQIDSDGTIAVHPIGNEDVFITVLSWDRKNIARLRLRAGTTFEGSLTLVEVPRQAVWLDAGGETASGPIGPVDRDARVEVFDATGTLVSVGTVTGLRPGKRTRVVTRLTPGPYRLHLIYGSVPREMFEFEVLSGVYGKREQINAGRLGG